MDYQDAARQRTLESLRRNLGAAAARALDDPLCVEIMANPDGGLWTDRLGDGLAPVGRIAAPAAETVIRLVASLVGQHVTEDHPAIAATLPFAGERFQGLIPPLVAGPTFSIRKRAARVWTLADYVAQGVMNEGQRAAIEDAAATRANILIAGGTGSGKTTLANAILALPCFTDDRVVLIEDTPELQCAATNHVALLTQEPRGDGDGIGLRALVKTTLRLRPDRIVIGEVRDAAALDLLKAWNTGHPGGLATVHANGAEDALRRLEELIGEAVNRVPRRTIAGAIGLIVFMTRDRELGAGRRVRRLARVSGVLGEDYRLDEVG